MEKHKDFSDKILYDLHLPQYLKDAAFKRKKKVAKVKKSQRNAQTANDIIAIICIGIGLYGIFISGAALGVGKLLCLCLIIFGVLDLKGFWDIVCKECEARYYGHRPGCSKGKYI